jgi:Cof subfamily protein (haloacid dehalogenase superfamily)
LPALVAVDLDGTLLRQDLSVSSRTREALAAARGAGAHVVIVTARSPRSVQEIASEAGISGLAICANGATLYDLDQGEIVDHTPLANEVGRGVAQGLRAEVPGVVFGWELELQFGSEPAYEALRTSSWWPRPEGSFPPCDVLAWEKPFTKLLGRVATDELAAAFEVAVRVASSSASVTLTGDAFVEVMAPGVSKRSALERLATELGITAESVVAFGDQLTDAGMLEWAGHGVAMANAAPEALAVADEVAPSNDADGVAIALERLLSEGGTRAPTGR